MNILPHLIDNFGLSKNEARVYTALLAMREAKASEIARISNVPRTKLYEVTRSLHNKGFIEIIPDRVKKYKAVPFDQAFSMYIQENEKKIDDLKKSKAKIADYLKKFSQPEKRDDVGEFIIYRARKNIYSKIWEIIENAKNNVIIIANPEEIKRLSYLHALGRKDNLDISILTHLEKHHVAIMEPMLGFMKKMENKMKIDVRDYRQLPLRVIMNEKEMIVFQSESPAALYSRDEKFILLIKNFFSAAWEDAEPLEQRINELKTGKLPEFIRYVRGRENYYEKFKEMINSTKNELIVTTSANGMFRIRNNVFKEMENAHKRGVKIMLIAPVVKSNMSAVRDLSNIAEIRHVGKEYSGSVYVSVVSSDEKFASLGYIGVDREDLIAENDVDIITNQHGVIQMINQIARNIWESGKPLDIRIHEIESGKPEEEIMVIRGDSEVSEILREKFLQSENEIRILTTEKGIDRAQKYGSFNIWQKKSESGVKVRIVIPVTKANLDIVKSIKDIFEIRHVHSAPIRLNIIDSETCFIRYGGDDIRNLPGYFMIYTNSREMITSMTQYFDEQWNNAMPIEERLVELESGENYRGTVTLTPEEGFKKAIEIMSYARKEVLISTSQHSLEMMKNFPFRNLVSRGVRIGIAVPVGEENMQTIQSLMSVATIKHILKPSLRATIVDNSEAVVAIKEGEKITASVYSSDRNFVSSLRNFFDSLWDSGMDSSMRLQEKSGKIENYTTMIIGDDRISKESMRISSDATKTKYVIISGEEIQKNLDRWEKINAKLFAQGVEIKIITQITKENLDAIRKYEKFADIRHFNEANIPRVYISDEKEGMLVYEKNEKIPNEDMVALMSNNLDQVDNMINYFFRLWEKSIPSKQFSP